MKTDQELQLKSIFGDIIDCVSMFSPLSLSIALIDIPFQQMVVVSDDKAILLLDFINRKNLVKQLARIKKLTAKNIVPHKSNLIAQLEKELHEYFAGNLHTFKTPICFHGTLFQQKVWANLQKIPYGKTISYLELAKMSGNEKAFRAAANANANNSIAIVVPCHRVIQSNGEIGGYAGGVPLKKQLLLHEKNNLNKRR